MLRLNWLIYFAKVNKRRRVFLLKYISSVGRLIKHTAQFSVHRKHNLATAKQRVYLLHIWKFSKKILPWSRHLRLSWTLLKTVIITLQLLKWTDKDSIVGQLYSIHIFLVYLFAYSEFSMLFLFWKATFHILFWKQAPESNIIFWTFSLYFEKKLVKYLMQFCCK